MGIKPFQAAVYHVLDKAALGLGIERTHILAFDLFHDLDHEADQGIILILLVGRGAMRYAVPQQKYARDAEKPGEVPTWHGCKTLPTQSGSLTSNGLYRLPGIRGRREWRVRASPK